ncbi:MAG: substrate-binding domain-containing protein [Myxococcota bacterium]
MAETVLHNQINAHRERLGLSQRALADRVGVSRQAINAIEAGRQVPSTGLALLLARTLGCAVEDLFTLPDAVMAVTLASDPAIGGRVVLGRVADRWIAHPISLDATVAADGIFSGAGGTVKLLHDPSGLARNVLVAGCAPLLGALSRRISDRYHDARLSWIAASSHRALTMLRDGLVHVAGLHLSGVQGRDENRAAVQRAFPGQRMLIINLTRWRQGLIVASGNPLALRRASDLLRDGVRCARREDGAGATRLIRSLLAAEGAAGALSGPRAGGHVELARFIRYGIADAGVAIEGVALERGLDFIPFSEERFDLVVHADAARRPPIARLLDALDARNFRAEVSNLPGYDGTITGHVTTLGAA